MQTFKITVTNLESSTIRNVDYWHGLLTIEFNTGRIYTYNGVPAGVVLEFLSAESKGQYFNELIKDEYNCLELVS